MPFITINKQSTRFFVAMGKQGWHSFIMLGIYEKNTVKNLLCRVGKEVVLDESDSSKCAVINALTDVMFFESKARLKDEGVSRKKEYSTEISYHAYEITYSNYMEFIKVLETLQTDKNKFNCYKPKNENGEDIVELELTTTTSLQSNQNSDLKDSINTLSLDNSCRHTAIQLTEKACGHSVSPIISSLFFRNLPCKTELAYGLPISNLPFYVLPLSPLAYTDLPIEKQRIAHKLYRQMEQMLMIDPNSEATTNKFNCLKELYTNMLGSQRDLSLEQLLESIQNWRQTNSNTLNILRKTYFWDSYITRTSATSKLIAEIEMDLNNSIR